MKAITLIQPWASLIADGIKTIETRSWPTNYRGPIAIHAGKGVDAEACKDFGYDPVSIRKGCVIAVGVLTDCRRFPDATMPEDRYGDFFEGRYGFRIEGIKQLDEPIYCRGSLGLWEWNGSNNSGSILEASWPEEGSK